MNKVRVEFLRDRLAEGGLAAGEGIGSRFLAGKRVLDVGCGGGLFAEVGCTLLIANQIHFAYTRGFAISAWLDLGLRH